MLTGVDDSADALSSWFRRNPEEANRIARELECPSNAYKVSFYIGERRTFAAFSYRIAGQRKSGTVHIARRNPETRAAAERWLGALDRFEPIDVTVAPAAVTVTDIIRRADFSRFTTHTCPTPTPAVELATATTTPFRKDSSGPVCATWLL